MREYERLTRIDSDIDLRVGLMIATIIQSYEISPSTRTRLTTNVRNDIVRMIVTVLADGLMERADENRVAAEAKAEEAKKIEEEMREDLNAEAVRAFYEDKASVPF